MSEGTTEDTDVQKEDYKEVESTDLKRRSTRATRQVERLNPQWRRKIYHQIKREHTKSNKRDNNINKEVERTKHSHEDVARELEYGHHIICQSTTNKETGRIIKYSHKQGLLIARFMNNFQERVTIVGYSYTQQFLLKKGLKVFGDRGNQASKKELDQLYRRNCFTPVSIGDMTVEERRKAKIALMFLTEKRDGSVKGRMVYTGKPTREWLSKEKIASPTIATKSVMLTSFIDAYEQRDVMTADIPNAFIQADLPKGSKKKTKTNGPGMNVIMTGNSCQNPTNLASNKKVIIKITGNSGYARQNKCQFIQQIYGISRWEEDPI